MTLVVPNSATCDAIRARRIFARVERSNGLRSTDTTDYGVESSQVSREVPLSEVLSPIRGVSHGFFDQAGAPRLVRVRAGSIQARARPTTIHERGDQNAGSAVASRCNDISGRRTDVRSRNFWHRRHAVQKNVSFILI